MKSNDKKAITNPPGATDELEQAVYQLLLSGDKFTEFELIDKLSKAPYSFFEVGSLSQNLSLFQTHFILFHALYRLNQLGHETQTFYIEIHVLSIQLNVISANSTTEPSCYLESDGLRDYYLDWNNFDKTDSADVASLLSQFWQKYNKNALYTPQLVEQAQAYFEFDTTPTMKELKAKYRHKSLEYHPDKGGTTERFSELLNHYKVMKNAITKL
ncbi:hypothetical protein KO525_06775 [Psychrosphaera sp. B3R10]|uniref:DNA-J related domain-containing protein n=1 Tax=unclassified Psychrosphaera TaxID=2641570 RepID=UPI001C082844|nr:MULTISPECIES: DNA-J related domain-containing protein [unclassified Psychrosphaera]MBU2882401.1 hypothetical protein [Psychrosphaera sp. I2R16]MBU2989082.1 hypothetical protein [Psychrosphaera sp. B3R10]